MPDSSDSNANQPLFDAAGFQRTFENRRNVYQALLDEVIFILQDGISDKDIKTHGVECRIKSYDSIIKKCREKNYKDPLNDLVDIAGARVICLFRSDLEKIGALIDNSFEVIARDDKINESTDSFGYMSIHYICRIKGVFTGPRYQKIKNIKFEIQVRTLSMHAWAAISHYLDYKGEWDVPARLRKSLNALSGLFYVADSEFEQIYFERERGRKHLNEESAALVPNTGEINLDTLSVYLKTKFPDREHMDENAVSSLVKEIKATGYTTIAEIDDDIKRSAKAFREYESKHPPSSGPHYADVGVVRCSLTICSDKFLASRDVPVPPELLEHYKAVRHLVK